MTAPTLLWTSRSANVKTGDIPTAWIGPDMATAQASCAGCPLLEAIPGRKSSACYAWGGTPALGALSVWRQAAKKPARYTLGAALARRVWSARAVRLSAIGDAGRMPVADAGAIVATVKAAGLALIGYTHHHAEPAVADAWKGRLMASVDALADVDTVADQGWRVAVTVPSDYPARSTSTAGRAIIVCPAQLSERVTCNTCRICDGSTRGPVVAFRAHGNSGALLSARLES